MNRNSIHHHKRGIHAGFTLLESLIAIGFITVAMTAMLEINRTLQRYDADSHRRFVNTVTLENIVNHLETLSHSDRISRVEEIATSYGATTTINPFEQDSQKAVQITLSLGEGSGRKTTHFWSFDQAK